MFERFTSQARYAIVAAQEEARSLDRGYIGPEHLLLGLLREDQGSAARPLASAGITLAGARQGVEELVGRGEQPPSGHIPFTAPAKKCLELSLREAVQLGHRHIGSGHLLLGLISQNDSVAVTVLGRLGADLGQLRTRVIQELDNQPENQDDLLGNLRPASLDPPRPPRPRPAPPRPLLEILASLERIEERLTVIERHLGIAAEQAGGASDPGAPPS